VPVDAGAAGPGYGVTGHAPEQIAAMVYLDTGAAKGALDGDFDGVEYPLPSPEELEQNENLDGLSKEQLETFRLRAIPQPGAALRDAADRKNDERLDVPSTVICTGVTSQEYKAAIAAGGAFVAGLAEVRDGTYPDFRKAPWPIGSPPAAPC